MTDLSWNHFYDHSKKIIFPWGDNKIMGIPCPLENYSPHALWPTHFKGPNNMSSTRHPFPSGFLPFEQMSTLQLNNHMMHLYDKLNVRSLDFTPEELLYFRREFDVFLQEVQKRNRIIQRYKEASHDIENTRELTRLATLDRTWEELRKRYYKEVAFNFLPLVSDPEPWHHVAKPRILVMTKNYFEDQMEVPKGILVTTRGVDLFKTPNHLNYL